MSRPPPRDIGTLQESSRTQEGRKKIFKFNYDLKLVLGMFKDLALHSSPNCIHCTIGAVCAVKSPYSAPATDALESRAIFPIVGHLEEHVMENLQRLYVFRYFMTVITTLQTRTNFTKALNQPFTWLIQCSEGTRSEARRKLYM